MDVDHLQHLHGHTCQQSWYYGALPAHTGVGHQHVEGEEQKRHEQVGQDIDHTANHHAYYTRRGIDKRHHDHRQASRHHNQDGQQEERGHVVGKRPDHRARLPHLPYLVERLLDTAHQHQYRVEREQQADAEEDAALCVNQVRVHPANDGLGSLGLCGQYLAEPHLDILVVAETAGNGKHHRHDWHNGQQRIVGQRRSFGHHPLGSKEVDGVIKCFGHTAC